MRTLKIGGVPEHFNLPWHMAIEDQMFEDKNILVEWIDVPEGTGKMNKMLRNNELDLAVILTGGVIKDIANGNPSKIIQLYVSSPLIWGVHVAANSTFKTLADLKHATAAISRFGSGSHVMAHVQASNNGWDTNAMKFNVVNTLDNAVTALQNGEADYFMWEHFTTKPIVDQGIFRRISDFPTPWSCFSIAATPQALSTKKEAINDALTTINLVSKDFKQIPSIDRTLANRYEQKVDDIRDWLSKTQWSQQQISIDEIDRVQKRLFDLNMIQNTLTPTQYISSLSKE